MADIIRNETVDLLLSRRTVRSYTEEPLTEAELATLLECAMWSPSGRNGQPCHVRVVTEHEALEEINRDFKDTVGWDTPAYTRWDVNPVYQTAPALLLIFSEKDAAMDAGIMVSNIVTAAESLGLNSVIIGSIGALFDGEKGGKWKAYAGVPEEYKFMISVAVGHGAENPEPKPRKPENFRVIGK